MKKVLIINQYSANKGDRGVLFAMVSELLRVNDLEITVSTHDPKLWENYGFYKKNNIKFVPWGWDFNTLENINIFEKIYFKVLNKFKKYTYTINRKLFLKEIHSKKIFKLISNPEYFKALNNSDIVISTGGHHITTILSTDAISSQIYDISLSLSLKKKTIIWSQSIGPLDFRNNENKNFVYKILNDVDSIFLRDEKSHLYIKNKNNVYDTNESVFVLSKLFENYEVPSLRDNIVGISIYSTKSRTPKEKELYTNSISKFANYIIENYNFKIKFIPMEIKGSEPDDRYMINNIIKDITVKESCKILDQDLETSKHIKEVANCKMFVGHKTHSIIFALTSGTPLLALAYHPKSRDFMKQFDLEEFVIDDEDLSSDIMIEKFDKLYTMIDTVGKKSFEISKEKAILINKHLSNIVS